MRPSPGLMLLHLVAAPGIPICIAWGAWHFWGFELAAISLLVYIAAGQALHQRELEDAIRHLRRRFDRQFGE